MVAHIVNKPLMGVLFKSTYIKSICKKKKKNYCPFLSSSLHWSCRGDAARLSLNTPSTKGTTEASSEKLAKIALFRQEVNVFITRWIRLIHLDSFSVGIHCERQCEAFRVAIRSSFLSRCSIMLLCWTIKMIHPVKLPFKTFCFFLSFLLTSDTFPIFYEGVKVKTLSLHHLFRSSFTREAGSLGRAFRKWREQGLVAVATLSCAEHVRAGVV